MKHVFALDVSMKNELYYGQIPASTRYKDDVRCDQVRECAKRIVELKEKKESLVKQMVELSKDRDEYQV
jgi:hypothetical protein